MTIFNEYARYYDLLYRDKDYAAEADFIASLINSHLPGCGSILELGCGTGRHAELLAHKGYAVSGVDRSMTMLAEAEGRRSFLPADLQGRLAFSSGDIRSVRLGTRFDVVLSLFHVMSYQTGNSDLHGAVATAREHLVNEGLFLFDFWYGPAVLTDRPSVRVKRFKDREIEVTRIAEPVISPNENRVDVNYDIQILSQTTGISSRLQECHRMRYLFLPELKEILAAHGMDLSFACEWMSARDPGFDTWSVCVGARVRPA